MRKFLPWVFVLLFTFLGVTVVRASSTQAYQDYLYQFNTYRSTYNEFKIAKNEYEKFQTLTSQTTALDKTKVMLGARNTLLQSYLTLLNEKLNENTGLAPSEKNLYQSLIANEITFLDSQTQLIPSVGSLGDAQSVSSKLESHYSILQISVRQAIIAISMGDLASFAASYDTATHDALSLINANRSILSSDKQSVIDRWMLQVANKRSIYQQKVDAIQSASTQLKATSADELERQVAKIQKDIGEAKQYLSEGSAFLGELANALRYDN